MLPPPSVPPACRMADPQAKLFASAEQGDVGTLEACLAAGMSANEQLTGQAGVESALHVAARAGHAGCVVALLAAGADPNATNRFYESPLHEAASFGRLACVAALLATGKEPLCVFQNGKLFGRRSQNSFKSCHMAMPGGEHKQLYTCLGMRHTEA